MGNGTMRSLALLGLVIATAGCYSGSRANRDVNLAWRGHQAAELQSSWGEPKAVLADGNDSILVWTRVRRHVRLPSVSGHVDVGPGHIEASGSFRPGQVHTSITETVARVDPRGTIIDVRGPSLRRGAPDGINLRWGFLFGAHVGFGRLDDTSTPLPSGGLYIGGMLSRTVGLVGTYSMAAGTDDAGGAMAFGWGLGVQWWANARTWLRAGPAMVLAFDPGFEDVGLEPGIATGASYAIVRHRSFVLDLRGDLTGGTSTMFGTIGIGVNIN